jgi:DNA-binding MarR family transcriptional regulator
VRKRCPGDRRRYQGVLTEKGQTAHAHLLPRVRELRIQMWSGLAAGDYDELTRILETIRDNFPE